MERNLRVDGARVCVVARLRWHPGYFNLDSRRNILLRSLSDQTPSPSCIENLSHESVFFKTGLLVSTSGTDYSSATAAYSTSSSSPNLSRLSHSTCVSDSDAPSSDASASGDKLKKRRKYRKRRSLKRLHAAKTQSPSDGSLSHSESPSAAYCEEWIYNTVSQPSVVNKRLSLAGRIPDDERDDAGMSNQRRRYSLDDNVGTGSKKTSSSWLDIWHHLLKLTPKAKKKSNMEPIAMEIHPSGVNRSALPSISEADGCAQSETQSPTTTSNHSLDYLTLVTSSASSSLNSLQTACHDQSNPTNREVCRSDSSSFYWLFIFSGLVFFFFFLSSPRFIFVFIFQCPLFDNNNNKQTNC